MVSINTMFLIMPILSNQGALTTSQQLDLFRDYKRKVSMAIGKERTDDLIKRAVYIVSSGTNDFAFNYYGAIVVRRTAYPTISSYQNFLWQNIESFLQVCSLLFPSF